MAEEHQLDRAWSESLRTLATARISRLRLKVWEFAEIFITASGVIAVVMIVLLTTTMVRGINSIRRW